MFHPRYSTEDFDPYHHPDSRKEIFLAPTENSGTTNFLAKESDLTFHFDYRKVTIEKSKVLPLTQKKFLYVEKKSFSPPCQKKSHQTSFRRSKVYLCLRC